MVFGKSIHRILNSMYQTSGDLKINTMSSILIVGCGRVGSELTKALLRASKESAPKIYVTDVIKERAIRLSEYKPEYISRIKWKHAQDTPIDVDLIVVCVDGDSEKKLVDRIVLSKKNFMTLSDDNSILELYSKYEDVLIENKVAAVLGAGLFPGLGNVMAKHLASDFDEVHDIVVERLGFVSNASLSSVKKARREQPLGLRNMSLTDSKRKNAKAYSWFVPPYNLLETTAVATGVIQLSKQFKGARNISVRYSEPKLPTFKERVRHLVLREQLTSKNACLKVQITGMKASEVKSNVICVKGDALDMVCLSAIEILSEFLNSESQTFGIVPCSDYIEPTSLFKKLHEHGAKFYDFTGS